MNMLQLVQPPLLWWILFLLFICTIRWITIDAFSTTSITIRSINNKKFGGGHSTISLSSSSSSLSSSTSITTTTTTTTQLYAESSPSRRSFPLLPNLFQRPSNNDDDKNNVVSTTIEQQQQQQFTSSYVYDNTSNDGFIQHAKYFIQQTDCGIRDPTILYDDDDDDNENSIHQRFQYINAQLDIPLSKTEYITAGRFFNIRNTFPDFNYRTYDFRIIQESKNNNKKNNNIVIITCTCRCTGTMRNELRLRNNIIVSPTGIRMKCPPEAMTIILQRNTGKVIQFSDGFILDREIGNTKGTTGIQAASIIAGCDDDISIWDLLPPVTILQNIFARPTPPIRESSSSSTTSISPFPESVMIQLTKGILSSQMGYNDPTLLSDTTFTYITPTVGPVTKNDFIQYYAQKEFPVSIIQPIFTNFRIDPYDPVRVWVDVVLTAGVDFISPPQAMSFRFDDNGYCTRITSQAIIDPTIQTGTAGGLGGYEGYLYSIGQASLDIYTRPISRSLERLRLRLITPFTGFKVDEYLLPPSRSNPFEKIFSTTTTTTTKSLPTTTTTIQKVQPPPQPPTPVVLADNNEVIKRLERLKEFTSSIRIIPPSLSDITASPPTTTTNAQERLARATKAKEQSKLMIEKAKREAAALQQKIALAKTNEAKQRQKQQEQQQQQQAALKAKQKQQQAAATQKAAVVARQKEQLALEQQRRKEEEMEQKKRVAAAAAAEAEIRQQELEAQRIAGTAAREAKKVQLMKEQLAAAEARTQQRTSSSTTANKAKVMAERIAAAGITNKNVMKKSPSVPIQRAPTLSRSVYNTKDNDSADGLPRFDGLARATISLFGLGKSELDELPPAKSKVPSSSTTTTSKGSTTATAGRRAPMGVPTITRWRKNSDQTISGLVKGSRNFDDGSRITTSPITSGTIASGEVVRTGSGSRYFLE